MGVRPPPHARTAPPPLSPYFPVHMRPARRESIARFFLSMLVPPFLFLRWVVKVQTNTQHPMVFMPRTHMDILTFSGMQGIHFT